MAREIRITIDDDEVFERMKYRKADLDLTWEEALKRGLRSGEPGPTTASADASGAPDAPTPPDAPNAPEPPDAPSPPGGPDTGDSFGSGDRGSRRATGGGRDSGHSHGSGGAHDRGQSEPSIVGDFADQLRKQIQGQVRESLESSMQSMHHDLDREMRDLQAAEDAVLRFDVLDDDLRYDVPLRVRMETSRSGLDVDVVAVREGKSAKGSNRFDRSARRRVNEHLATGGTATLAFGANGDAETYEVAPVCSWGHHEDGSPRVTGVEIHEVLFDAE